MPMHKIALIFVNGMEKNVARTIQLCNKASFGAYNKLGFLEKGKKKDFETVVVQVLDMQNLMAIKYNVDKYGINYFLVTNDEKNPDSMQTVLAVGPEEPERLNKMSASLRLF